jgi:3-oxoacyl-[acyl-carrier-protein] synthase-3
MPGLAPIVQAKIGAHNGSAAYDIITACAGWMSGLQAADAFIRAGVYKNVLVIGSEAMSRFLNWNDKTTCVLFGDGAGASLVAAGEPGCAGEILSLKVRADGRNGDILEFPGTGSRLPASHEVVDSNLHCVRMDGEKVFSYAIRHMSAICEEVLKGNGLTLEDVDWFVPHQANAWIIKLVAERLNFPEEKVAVNIHKYGNTTAATVPTCFDEYVQSGKIKRGQLVMIASFGGGLSWAGGLIRW